ncbi:S8 family serine peptidase [Uliginosibacterium sediminicola]|uniref:S8 family serine peptidase n=1 Tax=Uliginosibacterium sediminicola TaxID=2024550 RepID=UPI0031F65F14
MSVSLMPRLLALLATLSLAACGGGGGGGGSSTSTTSSTPRTSSGFTLSGSISVPDNAAVDSDTNDPLQVGWVRNDTIATAQAITAPVQLIGSVNRAGQGPTTGYNYTNGDELDVFSVSLSAGQTIDLGFVGDVSSNDLDLFLFNSSGSTVGKSQGKSNRECITVSKAGSYYIGVQASSGYGLYNMYISAPGEASSCSNAASSTALIASGQLVAKERQLSAAALSIGEDSARLGRHPRLLEVPDGSVLRAMGVRARKHNETLSVRLAGLLANNSDAAAIDARMQREIDTLSYAKHLSQSGDYDYVEPNFLMALNYTPTDPSYAPQRWHFDMINQASAIDRINALSTAPTVRPIVAVIDSGIVTDHPDLLGQQVSGYSFISVSTAGDNNAPGGDDPSTRANNPVWHGTHVAGTIAALSSNGLYGAGLASQALIMPLRVFRPGVATTTSYDVSQAILYAAGLSNGSGSVPTRRADVINMSLGGSGSCPASYADVITQARAQGTIIVAAAGNDARNDLGTSVAVSSPANCTGVISVGALNAQKTQAYYSNSGSNLTLAAPGGDSSQSTTGTGYPDAVYATLGSFNAKGVRTASFGGMMGTSMASPHVAAVMALMRWVNPNITPSQVDTLIALSKITDDIGSSGRDSTYGYGLINARKAVDEAIALANGTSTAPAGIIVASPSSINFGSTTSSATLSLQTTASTSETVTSIVSSSTAVSVSATSIDSSTGLGTYTVTVSRSLLATGTFYPTLTVTTSARSFVVQLSVTKAASSGTSSTANFGRLFVFVVDATTGNALTFTSVNVSNGKYAWSISGVQAGSVIVAAGSDANYDGDVCDNGEVCGQYPSLGQVIAVKGDVSGIDFVVAPTGISSSSALSVGGNALSLRNTP